MYREWYGVCDFVVMSRYVLTMEVLMCFMFVLILASSMVYCVNFCDVALCCCMLLRLGVVCCVVM